MKSKVPDRLSLMLQKAPHHRLFWMGLICCLPWIIGAQESINDLAAHHSEQKVAVDENKQDSSSKLVQTAIHFENKSSIAAPQSTLEGKPILKNSFFQWFVDLVSGIFPNTKASRNIIVAADPILTKNILADSALNSVQSPAEASQMPFAQDVVSEPVKIEPQTTTAVAEAAPASEPSAESVKSEPQTTTTVAEAAPASEPSAESVKSEPQTATTAVAEAVPASEPSAESVKSEPQTTTVVAEAAPASEKSEPQTTTAVAEAAPASEPSAEAVKSEQQTTTAVAEAAPASEPNAESVKSEPSQNMAIAAPSSSQDLKKPAVQSRKTIETSKNKPAKSKTSKPDMKNQPAPPAPCKPYYDDKAARYRNLSTTIGLAPFANGNFTLDFLYWAALGDSIRYAMKNYISYYAASPFVDQKIGYSPGARVSVFFPISYDEWDVGFTYTYFYSTPPMVKVEDPQANLFASMNYPDIAGQAEQNVYYAKGKWKLKMNVLDLELRRPFVIGKSLMLQPMMGGKACFIRQLIDVHYLYAFPEYYTANRIRGFSKVWGIGPEIGCEMRLLLPREWSLSLKGALSALLGMFNGNTTYSEYPSFDYESVLRENHTRFFEVGQMQACVSKWWKVKDDTALELMLGWESQIWWGQMRINWWATASMPQVANLVIKGPFFRGSLNF